MTTHELKTWPEFFTAIVDGRKRFELRKDDRGFAVGDGLILKEWNPNTKSYTGSQVVVIVTYIVKGFTGIQDGYVIMGISEPPAIGR